MKIWKQGRNREVMVTCSHCGAELLIEAQDVRYTEIRSGWSKPSVTCPCCRCGFWVDQAKVDYLTGYYPM